MPQNILVKRRFTRDGQPIPNSEQRVTNCQSPKENSSFSRQRDSDGLRCDSECSSDSGRDSALHGEIALSPSVSFERPSHLNVRGSTFSSSSSADSFTDGRSAKSPSSPYPPGHISLLPKILENLVVSNTQSSEIKVKEHGVPIQKQQQETDFVQKQLSISPALHINNASSTGNVHHHPQFNGDTVTSLSTSSAGQLSDLSLSLLSPASRKRSNSTGNNNSDTTAIVTAPNNPKRKSKNVKRPVVDDFTTSPVSGTIIRSDDVAVDSDVIIVRRGDLDKSTNVVEITEEAKMELARIENKIGQYICKLCKLNYVDAFALASHNCSRIVHIEYQCPDCGKAFHCPANLASHRRWHGGTNSRANKVKSKSAPGTPVASKKSLTLPPPAYDGALSSETSQKIESMDSEKSVLMIPQSNMPFKKRFFFKKTTDNNEKSSISSAAIIPEKRFNLGCEEVRKTLMKDAVPERGQFQCQMCHSTIRGAEEFAKHWQSCLANVNRSWTSWICGSKRC